jgi:hypothetical protein
MRAPSRFDVAALVRRVPVGITSHLICRPPLTAGAKTVGDKGQLGAAVGMSVQSRGIPHSSKEGHRDNSVQVGA